MYVEAAERKRGWQATPRVLWRRQDRPASDSNLNYISEGYSEFKVSNIHKEVRIKARIKQSVCCRIIIVVRVMTFPNLYCYPVK